MNDLIREITEFTAAWKSGSLTRKDAAELLAAIAQAWVDYEVRTPFGEPMDDDDPEMADGARLYEVSSELLEVAGEDTPAIEGPLLPILLPILIKIVLEQLTKRG
jgi:hypothetical protein